MRFPVAILVVVAMGVSAGTSADEPSRTVKSAGKLDLGRVFMSPAERRELDRLRRANPAQLTVQSSQSGNQSSTAVATDKKAHPGGYIVPAQGSPYKWMDGDFQKTTRSNIDSSQLPGGVSIIRHKGAAPDVQRTNSSDQSKTREAQVEADSGAETGHDDIN